MNFNELQTAHPLAHAAWLKQYPDETTQDYEFTVKLGYVIAHFQDMQNSMDAVYDPLRGVWHDGESSDEQEAHDAITLANFLHNTLYIQRVTLEALWALAYNVVSNPDALGKLDGAPDLRRKGAELERARMLEDITAAMLTAESILGYR